MTVPESERCPECYGTGQKIEMRAVTPGKKLPPYEPCPKCEGTGRKP